MDEYRKLHAIAKTKDDYQKASKTLAEMWLKKAAEQGHPIAMYEYGLLLQMADERNIWYKKAFETNDPYVLGDMYYYGIYVGKDFEKCIENFLKSNHPRDLSLLGYIYCYGSRGLGVDLEKGYEYYLKSANMGYSAAQHGIANCYKSGKIVPNNLAKAYNWYKKAANQNYENAILRLKTDTFKNFDRHENARNALLCLIAIKKFRKDTVFGKVPMDIIKIIVKEIWNIRDDEEWAF